MSALHGCGQEAALGRELMCRSSMAWTRATERGRPAKYEEFYLKRFETVSAPAAGSGDCFRLTNFDGPHRSLGYRMPADVHLAAGVPIL